MNTLWVFFAPISRKWVAMDVSNGDTLIGTADTAGAANDLARAYLQGTQR